MIGDVQQPLLLVAEPGMEEEVVIRLSRVGFDNVVGYLKGGFESWTKEDREIDKVDRITPQEFESRFKPEESVVFDVRKESEYEAEHVDEAFSRPLSKIGRASCRERVY